MTVVMCVRVAKVGFGSGSSFASRVRFGFGFYTFGFLSGSGNSSRVRVGFSGFKI